jgi:hypothetical protein
MRSYFLLIMLLVAPATNNIYAQELYVFSEPASNMAAKSIGIRVTNEGSFNPEFRSRTMPELMFSFNKNLMVHAQGFLSDRDGKYDTEGGSFYAKYRFYSADALQSHFRMAAFGRISTSNRPIYTEDINLEGDNSGYSVGIVATQLLHKLALSGTFSYHKAWNVESRKVEGAHTPDEMLGYSLSSGYLLLPFVYKDYNQPNFNIYLETLGKTNPVNGRSYVDLAPALQVVINSQTRIDLGYRFQLAGNIENRYNKNMYLARVEFNFFNAIK